MTTEWVIRIIAGIFIMLSVFLSSVYNDSVLTEPTWL